MNIRRSMGLILAVFTGASATVGCAATLPGELVKAREDYRRASVGPAAQLAQAQLHVAADALAKAEQSFADNPDSFHTRDLAYVAQRKAELAEATASLSQEQHSQTNANNEFQKTQGKLVTKGKNDLVVAKTALAASEQSGATTQAKLSASEQAGAETKEKLSVSEEARIAADARTAAALAALARLAAVKEEPRGMVITLSGSVLFASNQATLLPDARIRLDQVADVLLSTKERNITVEGHTDSQGSDTHNMDLSRRRAEAVRAHIVARGYQADLIKAQGLGEGRPIADNTAVEGRANNRRVEIVVERAAP